MSPPTENGPKLSTEITVRISLTFQEAPEVHTLLAMTPVRKRGKLVRMALERYIAETAHPAGDVEQQILAISTWLRSRTGLEESPVQVSRPLDADHPADIGSVDHVRNLSHPFPTRSDPVAEEISSESLSINRWLQT